MKKSGIVFTIITLILVLALIGGVGYGYYRKITEKIVNPIVTIEIEEYGTIKLELYPEKAPNTVANFVALAKSGFYDGTVFHRIVKDFMIQGGGYTITEKTDEKTGEKKEEQTLKSVTLGDLGVEGSKKDKTYNIKGEMLLNGHENTLKHEEGVISMARTASSYDSATSQFFIMTKANNYLDGDYAAFGKVIEGLDIVHKIENAEVVKTEEEDDEESTPVKNIIIKSITVDTKGVEYGIPETIEETSLYGY